MKKNLLAMMGAFLIVATPSFANRGGGGAGGGSGGHYGDHTGRFPRPDVGGSCDKIEKKTRKDGRLENPGSGHWPE